MARGRAGGAQVVGHLQMVQPPVLPPICDLFRLPPDAPDSARPLHDKSQPVQELLNVPPPSPPRARMCPTLSSLPTAGVRAKQAWCTPRCQRDSRFLAGSSRNPMHHVRELLRFTLPRHLVNC